LSGFGEWARFWLVKNLFEIKNGVRWLVDGNVFENNWVSAQNGFSILFTPRNETPFMAGNRITDITFRNNIIRHVAGGINVGSEDDTAPASYASQQIPTARLYFYNNLFEDVNWKYNGNGVFFEAGEGAFAGQSGPQDIILDHNTVFQNGNFASLANCCGNPIQNFMFTNNIFGEGSYGWYVNGLGQSYNALTQVITGLTFNHNVWAGDPGPYQISGNSFPSDFSQVAFVNYNGGSGGDYHLASTSLYKGTASDGTDPGANMDSLNAMLQTAVSGKSDSSSSSSGSSTGSGTGTPIPSVPVSTPITSNSSTAWFEIANRNSGKCLTAQSNYTLAQYTCSPTNTAQMFSLVPSYDSNNNLIGYQIRSRAVNASMDVWGASAANGATIGLYSFANALNELFTLNADQHGSFTIVPKNSGSCFDIGSFSTADGAPLQQWMCNGGSNQSFALVLTAVQ
ncbi:MAG TPA: RICIN domain-containing protein, partial [Bryobacteraceae bacterium]